MTIDRNKADHKASLGRKDQTNLYWIGCLMGIVGMLGAGASQSRRQTPGDAARLIPRERIAQTDHGVTRLSGCLTASSLLRINPVDFDGSTVRDLDVDGEVKDCFSALDDQAKFDDKPPSSDQACTSRLNSQVAVLSSEPAADEETPALAQEHLEPPSQDHSDNSAVLPGADELPTSIDRTVRQTADPELDVAYFLLGFHKPRCFHWLNIANVDEDSKTLQLELADLDGIGVPITCEGEARAELNRQIVLNVDPTVGAKIRITLVSHPRKGIGIKVCPVYRCNAFDETDLTMARIAKMQEALPKSIRVTRTNLSKAHTRLRALRSEYASVKWWPESTFPQRAAKTAKLMRLQSRIQHALNHIESCHKRIARLESNMAKLPHLSKLVTDLNGATVSYRVVAKADGQMTQLFPGLATGDRAASATFRNTMNR